MKRKIASILLSMVLVFTMIPVSTGITYAAKVQPKAWVAGFADDSTSKFRASQMLVVKTSGFSDKAKLTYHYYATSDDRGFEVFSYDLIVGWPMLKLDSKPSGGGGLLGFLSAVADTINAITDIAYVEDEECDSPYFAVEGTPAADMKVRIVVSDTNEESETYGESVEIKVGPFNKADLTKDICAPHAMFEGESASIPEILATSGVGHIYPECDTCASFNSLSLSNVDSGTISWTNAADYADCVVTADQAGLAKMKLSVTKAESCTFQPGLTGSGESYIKVLKKPVVKAAGDGFDITNTEKGVTYTVGNQSVTCKENGEQLSIRGLAEDCKYEVICSYALPNGMKAKASVTAKTLKPYEIKFNVAKHKDTTGIPEKQQASRSGLEKALEPVSGPYAPGYILSGWYSDPAFDELYDFEAPVEADLTIYGKWDKLKHTAIVNLTLDGEPYSGVKVELYQKNKQKYELTETGTAGSYSLSDAVETGVYDIYVDGNSCYASIDMAGKKTEKDLTASQAEAHISGETITANVDMISLKTTCLLDGAPANVGSVYYRDETAENLTAQYVEDASGKYYFAPTSVSDPRTQDIFVNGRDSDLLYANDKDKDISVSDPNKTVEFFSMIFDLEIDDSKWESDNVVLRDKSGNYVADMIPQPYDSVKKVKEYSGVLQKDDKTVPDQYFIYLDDVNTNIPVTATADGHIAKASAYKAEINLTKDGTPWNDAYITIVGDKYNYSLYEGKDGKYVRAMLYDKDDEKNYTVTVNSTVDSSPNTLNKSNPEIDLDYYTVEYYSYQAKENTDDEYELSSTPYRTQRVRKDDKALKVADPYVPGLTFDCFSKNTWSIGETSVTPYDYNDAVTAPLTLYAHFEKPGLAINGFVKSDETGAVSSNGDYFILPNLSISGFDEQKAIKSIVVTSVNMEEVTFPVNASASIASATDTYTITFNDKVSMTEAQVYLRNTVFKPVQSSDVKLTIVVSDGVADASAEAEFTQEEIAETWTKLSTVSGATGGFSVTLAEGNYYADQNFTFNSNDGIYGLDAIKIEGTVKLYIPKGITITAYGHNAREGTTGIYPRGGDGAGAGVYLPKTSTLYLYGEGTLNATGGNAGSGTVGDNGEKANGGHTRAGTGGAGGGGAGAGIGTHGGVGGAGGITCDTSHSEKKNTKEDGETGNKGSDGNQADDAGIVYNNGVTINANGGGEGTKLTDTSSAGGAVKSFGTPTAGYITTGGGGGGGNGAPGRAGNKIGPGGSGGAGGGSGGTGACVWQAEKNEGSPNGGRGGNGDGSGNSGKSFLDVTGGKGGAGGSTPANKSSKSAQSCAALAAYKVTFDGATETPTNYKFTDKNVRITVPDYTPQDGEFFLGWRVSTYGKNLNGSNASKPLTTAETKLYQPRDEITLAELTYGNIELKPATITIAGKSALDEMMIEDDVFAPSAPEITYYTYKAETYLDDVKADIGTLVLKPESGGDNITLGGGGTGEYSFTTTDGSLEYRAYLNNEDTGVVVKASETSVINARSIRVTTNLNDVPSSVPGDVLLKSGSDIITTSPVISDGKNTGTYRVQKVGDVDTTVEYDIYVDGKATGKTVSFGKSETVDFYELTVNVNTNADISTAALKTEGEADITLNKKSNGVYTAIKQAGDKVYDLYINGLDSGKDASFTSKQEININMALLTAKLRVNDVLSDDTGYTPLYNDGSMEKTGTGVYTAFEFGDTIAKVKTNGVEKSFTNKESVYDYYTVTYVASDTDVSGSVPVDNKWYIKDSKPIVSSIDAMTREGYQLQGWSIDGDFSGKIYKGGDELPEITKETTLNAVWKALSTYPIVVIMDGETIYADPDDLYNILDERNYPAEGEGEPGLTIVVQGDSSKPGEAVELPDDIYLGPNDKLIINDPVKVEIGGKLINEGEIEISGDGTAPEAELDIEGTLDNKGDIANNGKITIEDEASFVNENGASVNNEGEIEVKDGGETVNKGDFVNSEDGKIKVDGADGSFHNDDTGILTNDGDIDVNGTLENDGEIYNNNKIESTGTPQGEINNDGLINGSGGGTLKLPVDNEDGIVISGKLEAPGTISGGTVVGVDTSAAPGGTSDTRNSAAGISSVPASGGALPAIATETDTSGKVIYTHPTQTDIDSLFGTDNAILALDEDGNPYLDENGGYAVVLKRGVELKNPIVIPEGTALNLELAGSKIVGPDGKAAIEVTGGKLNITDSIGSGGVSGGMGTTESGGTGDGGNAIEVTGNGDLTVNGDVNVIGGPGVGSGKGGSGIMVDLDPAGTGSVYVNGNVSGGNGGSDSEGASGNGGSGIEIKNSPEGKVTIGPEAEIAGGIGGTDSKGKAAKSGSESQLSPEAKNAIYKEPISNDDNVVIRLLNSLRENGESQEQMIEVTVNGVVASETDYTVSKNVHISAGDYVLKVTFNYDLDSEKPYADLADKSYYKDYSIAPAYSGDSFYVVTLEPAENGTVTVSPKYVPYGGTVTITATPDEGYEIDKILVNGEEVSDLTVKNVTKDTKIEVTFKEKSSGEDPASPTDPGKEQGDEEQTEAEKMMSAVKATTISGHSKTFKTSNGRKIRLYWKKSGSAKIDCYQIYKSTKKTAGFKKLYTTKNGKVTTYADRGNLKVGKRYFYKVRGVRTIKGKKYYTKWSNTMHRIIT